MQHLETEQIITDMSTALFCLCIMSLSRTCFAYKSLQRRTMNSLLTATDHGKTNDMSDSTRPITSLPILKELNTNRNVILGSASPRRSELLTLMGITRFSIEKSDFAEDLGHEKYETAAAYCEETARHKLEDVAQKIEKKGVAPIGTILLGADTIVEVDGKILEKPRDFKEAYDMISRLSGSRHTVHTAVVIFSNGNLKSTSLKLLPVASFVESTFVNFIPLSESDKLAYIETKEGFDKAGGYGIQGFGGQMVEKIDGCYFNVMGLPITSLSRKLASLYYEDKI